MQLKTTHKGPKNNTVNGEDLHHNLRPPPPSPPTPSPPSTPRTPPKASTPVTTASTQRPEHDTRFTRDADIWALLETAGREHEQATRITNGKTCSDSPAVSPSGRSLQPAFSEHVCFNDCYMEQISLHT